MKTGEIAANFDDDDQQIEVHVTLFWAGIALISSAGQETAIATTRLSQPGAFCFKHDINFFTGHVPERTITDADGNTKKSWSVFADEIDMIQIFVGMKKTNVSFEYIKVSGISVIDGKPYELVDKSYAGGNLNLNNNSFIDLPTSRPPPRPPPPGRPEAEIEEDAKFLEFTEHLLHNRAHYERALRLGSTPEKRAFELASLPVGGASLLEKVENRPIEVLGDYVAYPCVDAAWSNRIDAAIKAIELPDVTPDERLVTLPTRGVFAEAKLGHCNASEEMDPTRFWKWEEHPIPHMAPEIAPIQGVTPQPQQQNLSPTAFPQSLVNIVNPPNAPDPTGLASAMNVMAASNIFRDMSGRAEVADLLKKLSDSSVAIAGVAQKAGTGGVGGPGSGGGTSGGASKPPATGGGTGIGQSSAPPAASGQDQSVALPQQTPEQKESQQIDNQNKTLQMAKDQLTPTQQNQVRKKVTQDLVKKAPEGLGFLISFQTAVYGEPIDGSARIEISPFGQRTGADYEQGMTVGPPSVAQKTTIPETFDVKITNGTVMIQTDHASAPGKVTITAYYSAGTGHFCPGYR